MEQSPVDRQERSWLTLPQLVEMLQITERHVRRLVAERRIPVTRVGGRLRFNKADILEWLAAHSDKPGPNGRGDAA
jgi:excisionase family DNA binding protein